MKKYYKLNGQDHVAKTREKYAPKEKVVKSKKKYNRKVLKHNKEEHNE